MNAKKMLPTRSKTLPSSSLFSGRGNRSSLILSLSEKSLVKKIAASIQQEDDYTAASEMSDLETMFNTSSSSFGSFLYDDDSEDEDEDGFMSPFPSAVQHHFPSITRSTSDLSIMEANQELWKNMGGRKAVSVIPSFHRKELDIAGDLLGAGAFSQVFAINAIHLNHKDDQSHKESTTEERCQLAKKSWVKKSSLVIKHLNRKLLQKPNEFKAAAMDLEREARILALARHANIIRLRGLSLRGGSATAALADRGKYNDLFLIMDRLQDTLDEHILRWKQDPDSYPGVSTIATYSQQLASALAYLHDHRLIYRDLKPQNVGFRNSNTITPGNQNKGQDRLQLFDFGLCRSLPPQKHLGTGAEEEMFHMSMAGTTRYMAPEIMLQEGYNCKADVYSWAVTIWAAIEHQSKPYDSVRPNHFMQFISELEIRPSMDGSQWDHVPEALKKLLRDAWCDAPKNRLSMADVFHQLTPIIQSLQDKADSSSSIGCSSSIMKPTEEAMDDSSMEWL